MNEEEESVFPEVDMDFLFGLEFDLQEQIDCGAEGEGTRRYLRLVHGLLLAAQACRDEGDVAAVHELWLKAHAYPIPSRR